MTMLTATLVLALAAAPGSGPAASDQAASNGWLAARDAYAAAEFERALSLLKALPAADRTPETAILQAQCHLGLGRATDAERVLEALVRRDLTYRMAEHDTSPALRELFGEVRHRTLPAALNDTLVEADTAHARGEVGLAKRHLDAVRATLAEFPAGAFEREFLRSVHLLAEQVDAEWLESRAPDGEVFDRGDLDVVAPVEIARPMPAWTPDASVPRGLYQGVLEVVIGANGRVASATVRRSAHPSYDAAVVAATETWRFEPATRAGVPVAYRKVFELIVHTRRSGGGGR